MVKLYPVSNKEFIYNDDIDTLNSFLSLLNHGLPEELHVKWSRKVKTVSLEFSNGINASPYESRCFRDRIRAFKEVVGSIEILSGFFNESQE